MLPTSTSDTHLTMADPGSTCHPAAPYTGNFFDFYQLNVAMSPVPPTEADQPPPHSVVMPQHAVPLAWHQLYPSSTPALPVDTFDEPLATSSFSGFPATLAANPNGPSLFDEALFPLPLPPPPPPPSAEYALSESPVHAIEWKCHHPTSSRWDVDSMTLDQVVSELGPCGLSWLGSATGDKRPPTAFACFNKHCKLEREQNNVKWSGGRIGKEQARRWRELEELGRQDPFDHMFRLLTRAHELLFPAYHLPKGHPDKMQKEKKSKSAANGAGGKVPRSRSSGKSSVSPGPYSRPQAGSAKSRTQKKKAKPRAKKAGTASSSSTSVRSPQSSESPGPSFPPLNPAAVVAWAESINEPVAFSDDFIDPQLLL
ncbi:hypothetical protein OF83DRAFT_45856 [Amylostereum chailletii]|nr:hypothetical protein OF83DRAFT_45856 [Amylostereum chailletii]